MGESSGKLTLPELFPGNEHIVVLIFGIVVSLIAIAIPKMEMFDEADLCMLPDDQRPDRN
jgi:hypothetical protein